MARIDMEGFDEGTEIVRVYLAATLAEAQAIEDALDAAGLRVRDRGRDVRVADRARRRARRGAAPRFWVTAGDLDACADALERAGHLRGLVDRG